MRHFIRILPLVLLSAGCMTTGVPGPDSPNPFVFVTASEASDRIASVPVERHLSFTSLVNAGEHSSLLVFRDATGEAELHEYDTDFWVVREGAATLVYGGQIIEPRETAPGEIRGNSIHEGRRREIRAGDIVNIPPDMSHQLVLDEGQTITYLIVKIREQ